MLRNSFKCRVEVCYDPFGLVCFGRNTICPTNGCNVIADTGTKVIVGPRNLITKINSMLGTVVYLQGVIPVVCFLYS